ncbi:MAG: hypothetical protein H0V44_16410 [Planctomycetes bacterium]|nr:hypothetical protein [Planctomycetota bacterium]
MRLGVIAGWIVLGAAVVSCQGCLRTLATALVAPEAVAIDGVSGAANSVASSLSGEDLAAASDMSTTARDLDRILQDHPDAANRPELEALRNQLDQSQKASQSTRREGSAEQDPARRAEGDRRVAVPEATNTLRKPHGDTLVTERVLPQKRGAPKRPNTYPDPVVIEASQPYEYQLSLNPVRAR